MAQTADCGICLARTDPDAPKHAGITYFIVDMHAEGIDIRPLRELTGAAMFNEVFLNDVFVPDDCVIGAPGDGWRIGRTTLANERVSMSSGASFGGGVESLIRTVARRAERGDTDARPAWRSARPPDRRGAVGRPARPPLDAAHAVGRRPGQRLERAQAARRRARAARPGDGHGAATAPTARCSTARPQRWEEGFLSTRCLTIAGGTSEVQRNVIAERMLGLPQTRARALTPRRRRDAGTARVAIVGRGRRRFVGRLTRVS